VHQLLAGLAIAAPVTLGMVTAPSPPSGQQVFRFEDPAITEASALVVQDDLFVTTNDSGDTGRVFTVDRDGETVGVTYWDDDAQDTEALAPGGPGYVWVGDIGDNARSRSSVEIARIPVGRGDRTVDPTTYRLTYPEGPKNAETLVRDPTTGRLYVVTKSALGGMLYAVPQDLEASGTNRLQPLGPMLPVATDGAFFPDGKHLIVRNYTSAVVYDWPSLQTAGSFTLPQQRQGEGIAVAPDGRVYVSSEGPRSPVLEVHLPAKLAAVVGGTAPSGTTSGSPTAPEAGSAEATPDESSRDPWPWVAGGSMGLAAIVVLILALRPGRRRQAPDSGGPDEPDGSGTRGG
jgi:hypothetical protein